MKPELRLELLKISRPSVDNPDIATWVKRTRELEAYVSGAGEPEKSVQQEAVTQDAPKVRTPRAKATA